MSEFPEEDERYEGQRSLPKPSSGNRRVLEMSDIDVTVNGPFVDEDYREFLVNDAECKCPPGMKFHANNCPKYPSLLMGDEQGSIVSVQEAATEFMVKIGLTPTPDAVAQLSEVFVPCIRIMCERPWDPNGKTWRKSGRLGVLSDARKKWERFWERLWIYGKLHDDSGFDLINYVGFTLRSSDKRWGEWGEPGDPYV